MQARRHFALGLILAWFLGLLVLGQSTQTSPDPAFEEQVSQGQIALKAGKYKDALAAFKKANQLKGNSCGACFLEMAVVYLHMGEADRVLENCDKAISFATDDPTKAKAHNLKGVVLNAQGKRDSKKLEEAEAEFRAAGQLVSSMSVYHLNLARCLQQEGKDNEAAPELQKCLALNPDSATEHEAKLLLADPRRSRHEFAPEFQITTLQGQELSLRQLSGRIVVMDFWATWCPPCRASVSELKDLTKKYPTEELVLISISADADENAWKDFVAKKKMDWAQFRDSQHKVLDSFQIHAFPTYLVIDGDGIIRERITGQNPQQTVVHRLKATLASLPQLEGEIKR